MSIRTFIRGRWVVLVVSIFAWTVGLAFVIRHLVTPSDGARLQPGSSAISSDGIILTPLHSDPGGLQPGDLVLAIEGVPLHDWSRSLFQFRVKRLPWEMEDRLTYSVVRDGLEKEIIVQLGKYPFWAIVHSNWGTITFALVFQLVTTFVFFRKPDNPPGQVLFLAASCLMSSTAWSFGLQVSDFMDGLGFWLFKGATLFFYNLYWTASFHFALIFPKPLPAFKQQHWFLPAIYGVPFIFEFLYLITIRSFSANIFDWFSRWGLVEGAHAALFLLAALVTLFVQYRQHVKGSSRQQIRWVAWAGLISGGGGLLFYILPGVLGFGAINPNIIGLLVIPFPTAIAIAILRHNLFDIDILINRTLVYGVLTAGTMGIYVFFVGFLGAMVQEQERSLIAFLVTGLVAVLFQPLRMQLQRFVNRWMYGERDDPYAVLSGLGRRLEAALVPEAVLPTVVETLAQALKLPYVAIFWDREGKLREAAAFGLPPTSGGLKRIPLTFQREMVGELLLAPRSPEEPFTPGEEQLIEDLTRQVEVAVHNVRLTADLRRSRQRLVTAREEERRRIRRDLHDGLGPQLASQALTLEAIEKLITRDPEQAITLIQDLKAQSKTAIVDIRRLIYDLRPPALDDLGLEEALRQEIIRYHPPGLEVAFQAYKLIPDLPAAVELAAFRIVQEAVNNVIKHADATNCSVCLDMNEEGLWLVIRDDGNGIPTNAQGGMGLRTMRERAEELGGKLEIKTRLSSGTQVSALLPLPFIDG